MGREALKKRRAGSKAPCSLWESCAWYYQAPVLPCTGPGVTRMSWSHSPQLLVLCWWLGLHGEMDGAGCLTEGDAAITDSSLASLVLCSQVGPKPLRWGKGAELKRDLKAAETRSESCLQSCPSSLWRWDEAFLCVPNLLLAPRLRVWIKYLAKGRSWQRHEVLSSGDINIVRYLLPCQNANTHMHS